MWQKNFGKKAKCDMPFPEPIQFNISQTGTSLTTLISSTLHYLFFISPSTYTLHVTKRLCIEDIQHLIKHITQIIILHFIRIEKI